MPEELSGDIFRAARGLLKVAVRATNAKRKGFPGCLTNSDIYMDRQKNVFIAWLQRERVGK